MSKEHIYKVWAPGDSLWSPWVKPVLFACMDNGPEHVGVPMPVDCAISWAPPVEERVAMVLDLPLEEAVNVGLNLAVHGYRPIPLYNALPKPRVIMSLTAEPGGFMDDPIVDVWPIMNALSRGAKTLEKLFIAPDAPPVFLLDANRRGIGAALVPGRFDNRSVSFTTDFPSAIFLRTHGISRVILVQRAQFPQQPDLAHTLRRWQEGGIQMQLMLIDKPEAPRHIHVRKPSWFGAIWYRITASMGLHRNILGGYGGYIAQPSSGG